MVSTGNAPGLGMEKSASIVQSAAAAGNEPLSIDGQQYRHHLLGLPAMGWRILMLEPIGSAQSALLRNGALMALLMFGLTALTLLASNRIYRSAIARILAIVSSMQAVQAGNLDVELAHGTNDEIGQMERNFTYMLSNIRRLLDEVEALHEKNRLAEQKYLQAQINPHFLYNALNTVSWTAMDYGADRVSKMLRAISEFYKLGLQPGKQAISLKDELRHAVLYIEIQNMRYAEMVELTVSVPEEVLGWQAPNMILQPLVENSILHGILPKGKKRGHIRIWGERTGSELHLHVEDDGVGRHHEELNRLLQVESDAYGLSGIQSRIRGGYGQGCGLSFEPSEGCHAHIVLREMRALSGLK
jgi:two-component system sensor histidine kinase YesM